MTTQGYPVPPLMMANEKEHRRQIAQALGNTISGKMNAVTEVTLAAGVTTTTFTDARIGANTFFGFQPLTADAAGAVAGLYVSSQANGSATLTHSSASSLDRTFRVLLIG